MDVPENLRELWRQSKIEIPPILREAVLLISRDVSRLLAVFSAASIATLAAFSGNVFASVDPALVPLKFVVLSAYVGFSVVLVLCLFPIAVSYAVSLLDETKPQHKSVQGHFRGLSAAIVVAVCYLYLQVVADLNNGLTAHFQSLPKDEVTRSVFLCELHRDKPSGASVCAEAADTLAKRAIELAEEARKAFAD